MMAEQYAYDRRGYRQRYYHDDAPQPRVPRFRIRFEAY